jgi:hypothetical protein
LKTRHRDVGRVGDLLLRADLALGVIGLLREAVLMLFIVAETVF